MSSFVIDKELLISQSPIKMNTKNEAHGAWTAITYCICIVDIPMPEFSSRCFDISKLSLAAFLLQLHPTCCGPDLTWHLFNTNGHSPLSHFLQSCNAEPWSGQNILIHRREISNPITYP